MELSKEQKKILHKKVHFTKIIYPYHKRICDLVLNPDDNNLYYVDHVLGNYTGRATENPKTWKISSEHVLYEMHKSGFVVSIFCLSIIEKKYPANEKYFSNAIYNCHYKVKANYDENNVVWIARVFLNGNDIDYC